MILDLVTGFSRSTTRSMSKCRGGQFCRNFFQKKFPQPKKRRVGGRDVNNEELPALPESGGQGNTVFE